MNKIGEIEIIDGKKLIEPVFNHFKLEYGDNSVIEKIVGLLNMISSNDSFDKAVDLIQLSKPFDLFTLQNLYKFIHDFSWIEKTEKDKIIDSELTLYNNALASFCIYVLKRTREYDEIIKYFMTYSDLIYYLKFSTSGKKIIVDFYFNRGIDFFLSYKFSSGQHKATEYLHYFNYVEYIKESLISVKRYEESEYVSNEIEKRKLGLKEITDSFTSNTPDKTFEALRIYSERFWFDYLGEKVFTILKCDSKNELIDSFVTELLIEKKVLTNFSQVAFAFCKVIERELNESLFQPFISQYRKCSIGKIETHISNTQRNKIEIRLNTINIIKKCVNNGHQLTFGQIVYLMRFWNDPIINEYSDLFNLINKQTVNFADLTQSIHTLLVYFELNDIGLTLTDIRNSSAHPIIDKNINWAECVKWIKQMLGGPPKEILKKIVIDLR